MKVEVMVAQTADSTAVSKAGLKVAMMVALSADSWAGKSVVQRDA